MADQIDVFLTSILDDAGKGSLPEAVKKEMLKDLRRKLDESLMMAAIERLGDKSRQEFNKLAISGASSKEKEKFLKRKVANLEDVFKKAMLDFRRYYLEGSGKPV